QFIESGYCFNTLIPKFIRKNQVIRYDGQFIKPHNPHFELDYMTVFRTWLFQKYFQNQNTIYEFGCGTGLNLVLIDDLLPGKKLYGLDFVNSSVDLIEKIGTCRNGYIKGRLFDMINPDNDFNLDNECAVFTFGVIEQLAGKFENFLQFLLKNKPHVCLHVEPTIELYDEDILFDYLAMMYHRKRGYTEGFLPRLKELESCGKLKILKTKRLFFGSQFMEGYMYFVWQPL
ncbi:MAG: class I SAM-dependent methyltransferase, partial [Thermodesulfobacteriota bacterium]|nr:class I SAM-dependent methyltransferase [Thermodesulfobacteriota bacterium]